jgi:hypothetical protein
MTVRILSARPSSSTADGQQQQQQQESGNHADNCRRVKSAGVWNPHNMIRSTVLNALGVLAALTIRDFATAVFALISVDQDRSIAALFVYTLIIMLIVVVVSMIWS